MNRLKLVAATIVMSTIFLSWTAVVPGVAADAAIPHRHHHYASHGEYDRYRLPYPISYLHNYGPGFQPGTFAYYDGPSTNHCYQGSAVYIGQDGRRHPCF
jgi:hypothetical protein